jgi:hypothetical protein
MRQALPRPRQVHPAWLHLMLPGVRSHLRRLVILLYHPVRYHNAYQKKYTHKPKITMDKKA